MFLAFILGREPHLSVAEIAAVLPDALWSTAQLGGEVLVLDVPDDVDISALMERLGGTTKIGVVLDSIAALDATSLAPHILHFAKAEGKIRFGCSIYSIDAGEKRIARIRQRLSAVARELKALLRDAGRSARHVTSREQTLSSVTISQEKLLPHQGGIEFLVLVANDTILLARTMAIQPFWEWSKRDYGRPGRDAQSGMLPPKLARMMLNLARIPDGESVLDPFCGSGTILTEALRLGYPRIWGLDVSEKAVADSRENVVWEAEHSNATSEVTVVHGDVREFGTSIDARVRAIVTEPYLGPSHGLTGAAGAKRVPTIVGELRALYVHAFEEFARALTDNGRIVFIVPTFHVAGADFTISIDDDVQRLGFVRINPFPEHFRNHRLLLDREHLPYAREQQVVTRNILIFERAA
ncbi:MAG: DNA methyltransferase [Candidatus Uhrbacteria bacterium]